MPSLTTGKKMWRSLDELSGEPSFLARAAQEFPMLAHALADPVDRREVLKLLAAFVAWSGLAGCDSKFGEPLIPPVRKPANIVPGRPNFYATAQVLGGYAQGIVVKHVMGRPLKVEGNPHHPASLGATDALAQALPLDFYDPDRAAQLLHLGDPVAPAAFANALGRERETLKSTRGAGLRILTGSITSPSLLGQLRALLREYPEARWISWEPLSRDNARFGAQRVYGQPLESVAHLDNADVVLALDSDLFTTNPGRLRYAREFGARRNPARGKMSRIYALESTPTLLGSVADHRFMGEPAEIEAMVGWIWEGLSTNAPRESAGTRPAWMPALIEDLKSARGRALVYAGAHHSSTVNAQVLLINEALQGRNVTFTLIDPQVPQSTGTPAELILDIHSNAVTHLLILDSNPVYAAPAAWEFAAAMKMVPFSVSLARHVDETAQHATWFVPLAHDWECWGDARAYDGSATILQPQALPLYGGLSAAELLEGYLSTMPRSSESIVKDYWRTQLPDFEPSFARSLASGMLAGTQAQTVNAKPRVMGIPAADIGSASELSLTIRADTSLWDGRFANNPWLQELPRPLTKTVWGNPLLISPSLAAEYHLSDGDVVQLSVGTSSVTSAVMILPGQARHCITAHFGSGRSAAGRVGDGVGSNFHPLQTLEGPVRMRRTGEREELATTTHHGVLSAPSEQILRHHDLEEFLGAARPLAPEPASLYRTSPTGTAQWGMSIDLNACIGCNACVIACQAENNIPSVGKAQVLKEREMHWLRIDRYLSGDKDAPESFFQPVLCMHCEQAPCENVCPVGATVHDAEGLNVMVYNRCVGTRFCSNNCPYKVRRFNFFGYAREQHRPRESWNPEVTTRARGVMEKCSYCVQRIAEARIEADRASKPIGKVTTACESACPTRAFTFGNLADAASEVVARKQSPLDFVMLPDEGTRPRTSYEAKIRNPNPKIPAADS
jgi:molybdopterin-containing oxidoreductase family iron-sulfur binding subunit